MIGIPGPSGRRSRASAMAHLINGVFAADMIVCSLIGGFPRALSPRICNTPVRPAEQYFGTRVVSPPFLLK
jgi:hypothetical protein